MRIRISFFLPLFISSVALAANPFVGHWELTIPGGAAGWLGVEETNGTLQASLLWGSGSVLPLASAKMQGNVLLLERQFEVERTDDAGKKKKVSLTQTIKASIEGNRLQLVSAMPDAKVDGLTKRENFSGRRQPPLPPAPDLSRIKFGEPIQLFNGKDLTGWLLTDPKSVNGWSVKDGLLVNDPAQQEGKPYKPYGNLRTSPEFEDFNLQVEVLVGKDQNSGIYLRGIYEIQVTDSFGSPSSPHNMGALYSRITPAVAAEKPAGEWQTFDITLVDRHITVILNGKRIIDNQPALGCTGGALWSDVSKPGPIYLQGDHTAISYKRLTLKPVKK